ncbi:FAD-dependent oxidoreductase [Nocardia asteroides]|uniref:FAD-dependent oxidoreductase n=1 Tax=Nocardia asteroides TaxID=1824 RepID=UPI001E327003|nr:FAD-dependent oxidoreductase [Nocardia asteroides]UGT59210.1 FAD-dependent oxidoreductase [Nocardia asteroides]
MAAAAGVAVGGARSAARRRVVIAGLGDSGVLTAIRLARHFDVVGISAAPGLVSGQELGLRLTRPREWARDYWIPFDRFRGLDRVRTVHGVLVGADLDRNSVTVRDAAGAERAEPFDILVLSTGVRNGFWRVPDLRSDTEVARELRETNGRIGAAHHIAVIGGGAAAVGSAANLARTWPEKRIALYFPRDRALTAHHPRIWDRLRHTLTELGVELHPGHRADDPADAITTGPVRWRTGQPDTAADAVLWTVGRTTPNTGWLPAELLDEHGFVRTTPELRVPGHPGVFAIGDVAATDPLRGSARNRADGLLARNIRAEIAGRQLRRYRPPRRRWGSVLGPQPDGLDVFAPNGRPFHFPGWSIDRVLRPWITRWGIYRGVRANAPLD